MRARLSLVLLPLLLAAGCDTSNSVYCCQYEQRTSGCGGTNFNAWDLRRFTFDIEDYAEGTTPGDVCAAFSGSETETGGGCSIVVEYRENVLSDGECEAN